MITQCTLDALKSIRFGYGFAGHQKTLKLRFKADTAQRILSLIPQHFHKHILYYKTQKDCAFIGAVEHQNSHIWPVIESALITAKADKLRAEAEELEYGTPIQLRLGVD